MATTDTQSPTPASPSAIQTLVHFLRGGLFGGAFGLVFAALLFYVLAIGFLYAEQTVHGSAQESIAIPHVPNIVLAPPITATDLEPPDGKQGGLVDTDYLKACWQLVWPAIDIENMWRMLVYWTAAAALFGLAVGFVGALLRLIFGQFWSPLLGVLALLAALGGIGVFVAHDQYQIELPLELDAQGRVLIYGAVAALNLWWMSIAGFRFRALLFIAATVAVGEILQLGLPPANWTTTALWHFSLFLFVPTGYAWLAVERGQVKNIV